MLAIDDVCEALPEDFVTWDEASGLWTAQARTGPDAGGFWASVNERIGRIASSRNQVMAAYRSGVREFRHEERKSIGAITPDATYAGAWRWSAADPCGFYGHRVYRIERHAVGGLADLGYELPAPGAIDAFAATAAWSDGQWRQAIRDGWHVLRAAGKGAAADVLERVAPADPIAVHAAVRTILDGGWPADWPLLASPVQSEGTCATTSDP